MEEWLDIIDSCDMAIGHDTYENVHRNGLLHRIADTMVFDRKAGKILVRKRDEKLNADFLEIGIGGHVRKNEKYKEAAIRELKEEIGIVEKDVTFIGSFLVSGHCNGIVGLFLLEKSFDAPKDTFWAGLEEVNALILEKKFIGKIPEIELDLLANYTRWFNEAKN